MFERILPEEFSIDYFITFLEKDRFTVTTAFIYLIVLGVLRSVAESLIFQYPVFSLYLVAQHTAFNFPVLVLGVLVIKLATDVPLRKVFNVVLLGFWVVVLPPYIDYLIFGLSGNELSYLYGYYAEGLTFVNKLAYLSPNYILFNPDVSPGLRFMLISIVLFSTVYIAVKVKVLKCIRAVSKKGTKPLVRKISAVFFGCIGIWLVIYFITSTVPSIITLGEEGVVFLDYFRFKPYNKYYTFIADYHFDPITEVFPENYGVQNTVGLAAGLIMQQRSLFLTMYFFVVSVLSMILTLWLTSRELLKKILSALHIPIVLATTVSTLLGSAVLNIVDNDYSKGWALDISYILHLPYLFSIFIIGFFLGCFSSYVWDHYREDGCLHNYFSKQLAVVSLLCAGSFAFLMGPLKTFSIFIITSIILFITFRYKDDVLDLGRSLLFSAGCLSISILGFLTPGVWKITSWDLSNGRPIPETYTRLNLSRFPEITAESLKLFFILSITVLVASYLTYLLHNQKFPLEFPYSLSIIVIFFIPALMFWRVDYLIVFGAIGFNTSIFLNKDTPFLPLSALFVEMIYILFKLWGIIPSLF